MGLSGYLGTSLHKCQEETSHCADAEEKGRSGERGGVGGGGGLGQQHHQS